MDLAAQLIVGGLLAGAPYAIAAWGLAVTLAAGTLNLASGGFFMAGAYLGLAATARGLPALTAAPAAAAAGLAAGLGIERVFVRPLRDHPVAAAAALLAVSVGGEAAVAALWGPAARSVPLRLPVLRIEHVVVAGAETFVTAGAVLAFIAAVALLRRTGAGLALRAAADNAEIAWCAGVDVARVRTWAFGASCAAAAAAGALLSPITPLSPSMDRAALLLSLAAVTAGGPTLGGLLAAALGLGMAAQTSAEYLAPPWATIVPALAVCAAAAWRGPALWRRAAV
jgi:branched-chain amino acid transport system permease protein